MYRLGKPCDGSPSGWVCRGSRRSHAEMLEQDGFSLGASPGLPVILALVDMMESSASCRQFVELTLPPLVWAAEPKRL